jgi:hypothetical protein
MNPTNRTIKIPTKTYLKKFILQEVGTPLITPGEHPIQRFLYILLDKKKHDYNFKSIQRQYDDILEVSISYATYHQIGFSLSQENVIQFNDYVEQIFDKELFKFCQDFLKYHTVVQEGLQSMATMYDIKMQREHKRAWFQVPQIKEALEAFAQVYQLEIELDLSFECLKKMEYRARKRYENKKNTQLPRPQLDTHPLVFLF